MPARWLTVRRPRKKATCSARLEGLRLPQAWVFSTSTSSSMSRMVSGPCLRMRATTRRTSASFAARNQALRSCQRRFMAPVKKRMSRVGTYDSACVQYSKTVLSIACARRRCSRWYAGMRV